MQISTIGLDIAKNVFQVHAIDAAEKVVARKPLRRNQVIPYFKALPPCLVGMEACASAHHWARELTKLGHEVRLMPAKDVKAYVKRNKNDAADAEAICEAVRRPTMRFVRVKSAEQQGQLMQHRTRDLLMRQRTQLINAMRAHLAELGIVTPQGREGLKELLAIIDKAHEFHSREDVTFPEEPDSIDEGWAQQVASDYAGDPYYQELKNIIEDLEPDQQIMLVSLMWVGRGDYSLEEWEEALQFAEETWTENTAEYLVGTPLLADYLAEGLQQFETEAD